MRHNKKTFTLGRNKAQKKALMRSLAESLIVHESIRTTKAKAKVLRTIVEPLITRAKRGNIFDKRSIAKVLYTKGAIKKIMEEVGPRFKERPGGYTRITKIGSRPNDGADMVRIELVK
tara:strand:+ start:558 stop:911 length:354 start_codon:yes stop_codon:yes gene_type:complete